MSIFRFWFSIIFKKAYTFVLDVVSHLHGLAFFKVLRKQQRQKTNQQLSKFIVKHKIRKLMIFKTNYFISNYLNIFFLFNISLKFQITLKF